ncbi:ROK family protein [Leptotrichia sp. OH3620_COT-345]|uniref:ROK family protein n=1 Tax=Leptotrichia sp. OH3620_COT-345 TaxID=2491048 RepID=UPI001F1B691B|nr:ROK family protein [Leptotrichia sp. OH3620_COT-345]
MYYICIDIGGISIKYGVFTENGDMLINGTVSTRVTSRENYILTDVKKLIKDILEQYGVYKIEGICISSAGVVDTEKGEIIYAGPTIPKYTGTKIKEELEKEFNLPCEVENDVNCAGLGEYWKGVGINSKSMVCITVGTGIGGSIILDGKLLNGIGYTAGEIGYMDINGNYIQNIASSKYLIEKIQKEKKEKEGIEGKISGLHIFELAKQGDKICVEVIDELIRNLSISIRNIIYLLNPEIVVIGGGITAQKEYLEEKIRQYVNDNMISDIFRKTKIKLAKQGNQAGLLGALYHFLSRRNKINNI